MWVYEIAILISDCPNSVADMLLCGNYEAMESMNVSSKDSFQTLCFHCDDYIFLNVV